MANTKLTRTPSGTPTSRTKATLSVWLKRAKTDEEDFIFYGDGGSSNRIKITFLPSGKLQITTIQSSSNHLVYETNRLFRDTSAWYHIVIAIDTTLGTAGDRCRLYVNGVEETSFSTETHFSQNDFHFLTDNSTPVYIGVQATGNYFDGSMSHINLIDGSQLAPTVFGETDATTGEWKIKTSPSVTYGTNGFFILKDGNTITDSSSNSNNFSLGGGTLTKTQDCPSNVFATLNPLDSSSNITFSNGNTSASANSNHSACRGTIGATSGKYYWENKILSIGGGSGVGVMAANAKISDQLNSSPARFYLNNGTKISNASSSSYGASFVAGDIIGIALNLDAGEITFYKNGTSQGVAFTDLISSTTEHWLPAVKLYNEAISTNFGNGYFGTTAVSSAGTNASGIGIFEYDVPSGYTALSTKGLNL